MSNLILTGLRKSFSGVRALSLGTQDRLAFQAGEIHALVGENGAGKSTLVSILSGNQQPTSGQMTLDGRPYAPSSVSDARSKGVDIVLQEPGLVRTLSVADNLFLGREALYSKAGLLSHRRKTQLAQAALQGVAPDVAPHDEVGSLNLEQQKFVELARAVSMRPKVLVVDEMTAAVSERGARRLFELLGQLKQGGVVVIYISHYLEEVLALCNRITVLKDGALVRTLDAGDTDENGLSTLMVGRQTKEHMFPKSKAAPSGPALVVDKFSRGDKYRNISFELRKGEVLGIGGLLGCGSEELALTLFGVNRPESGEMRLEGRPLTLSGPREAIRQKIAYVPKDRDRDGIVLRSPIQDNMVLAALPWLTKGGFVSQASAARLAQTLIGKLRIACRGPAQLPVNLSGGNRQKIALAKWMVRNPEVLILNNPTRGIDVGAKLEIYAIMRDMVEAGMAILLVSDELPELIGMSDRILMMRRGEITAELSRNDRPTEEMMISHML